MKGGSGRGCGRGRGRGRGSGEEGGVSVVGRVTPETNRVCLAKSVNR